MTTANAMEHTNAKQTLKHGQDIGQRLHRMPLTRPPPGRNSVHSQTISKRYITDQMLADGQNTNTTCKRKRYWPDKLLVVNYVKFHLTIFNNWELRFIGNVEVETGKGFLANIGLGG